MSSSCITVPCERRMSELWKGFFLVSAGTILLLTGVAKIFSTFSGSKYLDIQIRSLAYHFDS